MLNKVLLLVSLSQWRGWREGILESMRVICSLAKCLSTIKLKMQHSSKVAVLPPHFTLSEVSAGCACPHPLPGGLSTTELPAYSHGCLTLIRVIIIYFSYPGLPCKTWWCWIRKLHNGSNFQRAIFLYIGPLIYCSARTNSCFRSFFLQKKILCREDASTMAPAQHRNSGFSGAAAVMY